MKYTKSSGTGGAWVDKAKVVSGTRVKIVSESVPTKEIFEGKEKMRNIVKLSVEGDPEAKNYEINKPSLNALIEAFGEESRDWINKPLTSLTETVIVGGRRGKAMYLIPDGFEVSEDAGGFVVVQRKGEAKVAEDKSAPVEEDDQFDIKPEDIPFD